jgi:hypothetical protein
MDEHNQSAIPPRVIRLLDRWRDCIDKLVALAYNQNLVEVLLVLIPNFVCKKGRIANPE